MPVGYNFIIFKAMEITYRTQGVCARSIKFTKNDDGTITNIRFDGGCNGNLKAVAILVDGMTPQEINSKLAGNLCGSRRTSCADQLAKAVMQAVED